MMKVVLTGAAKDRHGKDVLRADLVASLQDVGVTVQKKVDWGVDYLVASRSDTVKARDAKVMGIKVVSYEEFFEELGVIGFEVTPSGKAPDPYVDNPHVVENEL